MLSKSIKNKVFARANFLCEYCLSSMDFTHQSFEIEHILPISKNGTDHIENLACACGGCNAHKYNKINAKDPLTNKITSLFNPRTMVWSEHFSWSDNFLEIIALTDVGRVTIKTLQLNRAGLLNLRRLFLLDGSHPPK
jgi:hypothetical protein